MAQNCEHLKMLCLTKWVRGVMVTDVGFELRDRSSNPSVCQITDDGLRQVVYFEP